MTKTKKPSRSKLVKQLDSIFSTYIRRKDAINDVAICFTCGKKDHYKKLQNGHFQSRRHYSTRFDEVNCQVQCAGCNVFKYGEQFIFGQNLDIKFGEGTARRLHIKAQQILKISDKEIIEMIKRYKTFVDKM
tara:strand:+ start:589 stop:984 length:396 start_codon:yes stop_codon:yes gene_type:complete